MKDEKTTYLQQMISICKADKKLLSQSILASKMDVSTTKMRALFGNAKSTEQLLRRMLSFDKNGKLLSDELKTDPSNFHTKHSSDELLRLGAENKNIRRELEIMKKELIFEERLLDILRDCVKAMPPVDINPKNIIQRKDSTREKQLLALWSDFHGTQTVNAEEMGNLNEFSTEILSKRFQQLIDVTLEKGRIHGITHLNIAILGDMISGDIHEELEMTNDMDVMSGMFAMASMLAQGILELRQAFSTIHVFGVFGNHGRLKKEKRFKRRYVNWDWGIYKTIELILKNQPGITCKFPKSFFHIEEILGEKHLFLHGDGIKSWGGVPFYGINRTRSQLVDTFSARKQNFKNIYLGHFHTISQLDKVAGEIIINGSMPGGDEYSLGALFTMSEPKQMLVCIEKDLGSTWREPIILTNAEKLISTTILRYHQYQTHR